MSQPQLSQLLLGFLLAILIAVLAWRLHALSRSGAWAAILTGGLIFGLGGAAWATLLLAFFISSSVLSRLFSRRKSRLNEKFSKGSRRDAGQVLANGGLGALLALLHALLPRQDWPWMAFIGAMAAVNADTWATELGVLSPSPPRLITSGRQVEPGTSGGISLLGTLSALAGAALVGICAGIFNWLSIPTPSIGNFLLPLGVAALGGLAGAMFDSFLGATVQAIYYCPACQKETERHPRHLCGSETAQVRGWRWLNNDLVNFACSLAGALVALVWLRILP